VVELTERIKMGELVGRRVGIPGTALALLLNQLHGSSRLIESIDHVKARLTFTLIGDVVRNARIVNLDGVQDCVVKLSNGRVRLLRRQDHGPRNRTLWILDLSGHPGKSLEVFKAQYHLKLWIAWN